MSCHVSTNSKQAESSSSEVLLQVESDLTQQQETSSVGRLSVDSSSSVVNVTSLIECVIVTRDGDVLEQTLQLGEETTSQDVYKAVCLIDNKIYLGDIQEPTKRDIIGILLGYGKENEYVRVKTGGDISNILWGWIPNSEDKIFLGENLETTNLTQSTPSDDYGYIEIGYPLSNNIIALRIQQPIIYV